ncbi:Cytochrome c-type biogenesis protein CcmF [compost metagenome]
MVLGEKMGPDAYAMRLHHKPLVRWIWLGGLLMMTGGALRLLGRKPLLAAQPQTSAHQVAGLLTKEAP